MNMETGFWNTVSPIGFIFGMGVFMGFMVGSIIVYQILYTDVSDHLSEYATLKAIGYRDGFLFSIVFKESLLLSVLGYVPGLAISAPRGDYQQGDPKPRYPAAYAFPQSLGSEQHAGRSRAAHDEKGTTQACTSTIRAVDRGRLGDHGAGHCDDRHYPFCADGRRIRCLAAFRL
jgi:hypothetical protein